MRCNNCGVEIGDNNICPLCQMIVDKTVVEIKNECGSQMWQYLPTLSSKT